MIWKKSDATYVFKWWIWHEFSSGSFSKVSLSFRTCSCCGTTARRGLPGMEESWPRRPASLVRVMRTSCRNRGKRWWRPRPVHCSRRLELYRCCRQSGIKYSTVNGCSCHRLHNTVVICMMYHIKWCQAQEFFPISRDFSDGKNYFASFLTNFGRQKRNNTFFYRRNRSYMVKSLLCILKLQ